MKRSKRVPATLIATIAGMGGVSLTGCSSSRTVQECVDNYGKVVPSINCQQNRAGYRYIQRVIRTGGFGSGSGGGGAFFGG